jgi:hypothetical protein
MAQVYGAARLDSSAYERIEASRSSNWAAFVVVIVSSVAAAIGMGAMRPDDLLSLTLMAIVSWLVWVGLTYIIGTKLLPEPNTHADIGEILRTTGFSAAPGVLRILAIVPGIGWLIFIAVTFWMLLAFVIAVRQALDYSSTNRAFAVCFLGWFIHGLLFFGFVRIAM